MGSLSGADADDALRAIALLRDVSPETLRRLGQHLIWRELRRGETIVPHLDRSASLLFLARGSAQAKMTAANGRTLIVRRLEAGAHFGELAALTGAPRSLWVVADADCLVGECAAQVFTELMEQDPAFARAIAISLAKTVVNLTDRLFELGVLEVRFRLYGELLRLAKDAPRTDQGI